MTREEQIRNAAEEHFAHSWSGSVKDAFAEGAQWADEQHKQEKQQWIEKACIWLYNWDAYRICLEGMKEVFVQKFKKSMEEEI